MWQLDRYLLPFLGGIEVSGDSEDATRPERAAGAQADLLGGARFGVHRYLAQAIGERHLAFVTGLHFLVRPVKKDAGVGLVAARNRHLLGLVARLPPRFCAA